MRGFYVPRMTFKDHFSTQSAGYARYRPTYPPALFDWLAAQGLARSLAWDVATGSGQAAAELATRFSRVFATDASAAQLANATPADNVTYAHEPAEHCSLADASADLVCVAQALHWFDIPAFFREAGRVLRPGGVLAAWCYEVFSIEAEIDRKIAHFYHHVVGPYWPPERRMIEEGYAGIALPFAPLEVPPFEMACAWNLDDTVGYLATWSAVQGFRRDRGFDPVPSIRADLGEVWGDPATVRRATWPLKIFACRKPA